MQLLRLTIPEVRAPFSGPLTRGTVVFASPNLVLVRIGDRDVTVRVRFTDLAAGAAVRVGLSPHGEARVIEFESHAGHTVRFDVP